MRSRPTSKLSSLVRASFTVDGRELYVVPETSALQTWAILKKIIREDEY
jgi:hypothetical protein